MLSSPVLLFQQRNDFVNVPNVIRYACLHCWRHAERLMHAVVKLLVEFGSASPRITAGEPQQSRF
jgi:hypothetical protein